MKPDQLDAIGLVEVKYFTMASLLLDSMCKGAGVQFISSENELGGRLVTLIVGGTIENVQSALEIANHQAGMFEGQYLMNTIIISQPSSEIMKYIGKERSN